MRIFHEDLFTSKVVIEGVILNTSFTHVEIAHIVSLLLACLPFGKTHTALRPVEIHISAVHPFRSAPPITVMSAQRCFWPVSPTASVKFDIIQLWST